MAEIVAGAREVAAIEQVSKAVSQVGQVTQQNAANSEESSAAAELSGQSEELAAMVQTFRLEQGAVSLRQSPKPAPKPAGNERLLAAPAGAKRGRNGKAPSPEDALPLDDAPAFKDF